MASLIKHNISNGPTHAKSPASVEYTLHHCFRSFNKPSRNKEIDATLTRNNYSLTPESRGNTTGECMEYYKRLLENTFIYGKGADREIVKCLEWSIQAPADLAPEQKPEFFKACYDYMNSLYGEENCIAAVVHTDEIMRNAKGERVSHDHLHYLAVPRVKNTRYLTAEEKFKKGIVKIRENGILTKQDDAQKIEALITLYHNGKLSKNGMVSTIAKETGCKYADARKIYNAVIRKDSEMHTMKLNSDALTSRKQLHAFHPGLQKYLDEHGLKCTVSYKSQGMERNIPYTVAEAKTVTRVTGLSIDEMQDLLKENVQLKEKIKDLTRENERLRSHSVNYNAWGKKSGWGSNRSWDGTIDH